MQEELRNESKFLRTLSSEDAANWLLENYPPNPDDVYLPYSIGHRSWKRREQHLLAEKYLSQTVFASSSGYEMMLKTISLDVFLDALKKAMRNYPPEKLRLLKYNITIALRKAAQNPKDIALVNEFLGDDRYWNAASN